MAAMLSPTPKRIFGRALVAVLVLVVVGTAAAFVSPSPHEIHTLGAMTLNTQLVYSDHPVSFFQAVQPSQSLNDVRCAMWHEGRPQTSACPDAETLAGLYFPKLTQSPKSLYVAWLYCQFNSLGVYGLSDGFNVEFQPSRRAVVIHCFVARQWVWREPQTMGAMPQPRVSLLVVPTASIPAGPVSVIEDDRVEHFLNDQSTESHLGTATIS
jgi:hypothetical protein